MQGLSLTLDELIALRRFAVNTQTKPSSQARRSGGWQSMIRGRGMDFAEVRNYQAGDEVRHMEWRVTARTGRAHVKLYQEERECPVILLIDFNPSMFFGTRVAFKSVIAGRLAAILAWTAVKEGDRLGGMLYSGLSQDSYQPRGREKGVLPLLAGIAKYSQQIPETNATAIPLGNVLLQTRQVIRPGSTLVLLTDAYNIDANCEKHLRRISQHNRVLMYHIADPIERTPPPDNRYALSNGDEEILLDTRQKDLKAIWLNDCQMRQEKVSQLCRKLMIQLTEVSSEDDLAQVVWQTFPRRRHGAF